MPHPVAMQVNLFTMTAFHFIVQGFCKSFTLAGGVLTAAYLTVSAAICLAGAPAFDPLDYFHLYQVGPMHATCTSVQVTLCHCIVTILTTILVHKDCWGHHCIALH